MPVLRMLTDRCTECCGRLESHPHERFLELNEIEHTRTKAHHPPRNGLAERRHKTMLTEVLSGDLPGSSTTAAWRSCSATWTTGWYSTIKSVRTRASGVKVDRGFRPSLTGRRS